MKPILIATYTNPDLDGFSCALAYKEYLNHKKKEAVAGIFGAPNVETEYLLQRFSIVYEKIDYNPKEFSKVILVDASDTKGIDPRINPDSVIEIIDQRKISESHLFSKARVQIELVGAAATLITEKFMNENVPLSHDLATLLMGAIISNTLDFRAKVTTERDRIVASWLRDRYAIPITLAHDMFTAKSDMSGEKLEKQMRGDSAWFELGDKKVSIVQIEIIGAEEIIKSRIPELLNILSVMQKEQKLDEMFISFIELDKKCNYFVTENHSTQKLLAEVLGVEFDGCVAKREGLIMRKEIVPLLKEQLLKSGT